MVFRISYIVSGMRYSFWYELDSAHTTESSGMSSIVLMLLSQRPLFAGIVVVAVACMYIRMRD